MNPDTSSSAKNQQLPAGLQPLFDMNSNIGSVGSVGSNSSSINAAAGVAGAGVLLDGDKADSARVLTPPTSTGGVSQQQQQTSLGSNASVFGRLPANGPRAAGSLDAGRLGAATAASHISSAVGNAGGGGAHSRTHSRTASYGTSLLDTLNEEKQLHQQWLPPHSSVAAQRSRFGHGRSATGGGIGDLGTGVIGSGVPATNPLSHQRHFTLSTTTGGVGLQSTSPFSLHSQTDGIMRPTASSATPPNVTGAGGATGQHVRAHTLTASPPGFGRTAGGGAGSGLLKQPLPTNASGILGAHSRLNSLSGTSNASLAPGIPANLANSNLLASSLRNSYSSNSLRSAFARRSSPSPLSQDRDASAPSIGNGSFDFVPALDESSVWGPSRLSNELDLLSLHDGSITGNSNAMDDSFARELTAAEVADVNSRIRSYSFNSPPDGIEEADDADIDVLHAAATSQNPALAFRKMMARTHARSKTLANPFGGENDLDYALGFQQTQTQTQPQRLGLPLHMRNSSNAFLQDQQQQQHQQHRRTGTNSSISLGVGGTAIAANSGDSLAMMMAGGGHSKNSSDGSNQDGVGSTVHIGIGGESVRGFGRSGSLTGLAQRGAPSASHSRQASMHTRQHSLDFDMAMLHNGNGSNSDNVPTRSLWVGNVDPGLNTQDLIAIFGKYGRVESLRLLPDKECAFVNFLRVEDAIRAKEDMHNGARIGNNTVRVGFGKGESYATGDAQAMQPTRALWIGNIAQATTPDSLSTTFQAYGTIESARVLSHKNCGFVNFIRLEDAVRAKQAMNGKSIDGSVVRIGYAKVPAAKNESSLKLRNPVPSAAPLTVSGQIAEADAITGTTQRGLGNDMVLEPGFTLAIDENLVAFPYAAQLPGLPEPRVNIRSDHESSSAGPSAANSRATSVGVSDGRMPVIEQSRLREIRKLLESTSSPIPRADFDQIFSELLPSAVELCTDYVGNVLVQKMAERGDQAQKLALVKRVGPYMASIGVHKNGTWAVQKIIDTATTDDQKRMIAESIKQYTPQLLLDQLGNYVVQCCLRFGPSKCEAEEASNDAKTRENSPTSASMDDQNKIRLARAASNQFVFDAIHARCWDIAQGRFGARAIRTCLESPHASKLQQKLVAVALVTNAVSLATNVNGHLLINWLLDSSKFTGRFRVLAHQLAPHLRYLATHKLGASTISKIVDQTIEPDARDLILNTLFFNPDPSVLDDVVLDQAHGVHVILKVLQGTAIGEAEKARIADRLRFLTSEYSISNAHTQQQPGGRGGSTAGEMSSVSPINSHGRNSNVPPSQRLADTVASVLAHSQPVYPPTMPPATHRASNSISQDVPQGTLGYPFMLQGNGTAGNPAAAAAMSFPAASLANPMGGSAVPPPAGFGGMAAPTAQQQENLLAAYYYQQQQQIGAVGVPPAGFYGGAMDFRQQQHQQQQQQQQPMTGSSAMPQQSSASNH